MAGCAFAPSPAVMAAAGLTDSQPVIQEGISGARVGAAAVSVAVTVLVLRLLGCPLPPTKATTLIVGLGLLTTLGELSRWPPRSCW